MLNIKKAEAEGCEPCEAITRNEAITVSKILINLVSLSLILVLFCLSGHLYAQMPGDFPEGREFDPRHPLDPRESGISPSAHKTKSLVSEANISENVELVGATGGAVYDVFVFTSFSSLLRKPPGQLRLRLRWRHSHNS